MAALAVVELKVADTPPIVRTVCTLAAAELDALCRTQTVCPLATMPAPATNELPQPIEYSPPSITIGTAVEMPATVIVSETCTDPGRALPRTANAKGLGAVTASCVRTCC